MTERRLIIPRIDPAAYGFIAAAALWGLTLLHSGGRGGYETITVALSFAIFAVMVGTGQMFVIASGPGNIDLSCPAAITLGAYLSMNVMGGTDVLLPIGLLVALGVGLVVGLGNYGLIRALRIPPIIATLAISFIVMSVAMNSGGESTVGPPTMLANFTELKVGGIQILLLFALAGSLVAQVVIRRTRFGRQLMALGQNERAAGLAGVPVNRVRMTAYLVSGALAGLTGFFLAGFTGGAALNMGNAYLMESVAVAVLGGTSVSGGRANAMGIWGAALFLSLLATALNASGVSAGWRFILSGATIVLVTLIATEKRGF